MPTSNAHTSPTITSVSGEGPLAGAVICCTSVPEDERTKLAAQAEQMGAIHRFDLTLDVTHLIVGNPETEKYIYVAKERLDVQPMTTGWIAAVRELWISDQEIDTAQLEREHRLPTLHSLCFSMTGCDDPAERSQISEQVKANGGIYSGDLTKQITHLISFRTEGAKYAAAKSWGIKVVSIEWLWDTLERGMILNEELYDPILPSGQRGLNAWNRSVKPRTSLGKRNREEIAAGVDVNKRRLRRTASSKLSGQNEQIWGEIVGGGPVPQVNRSGQWDVLDNTGKDKTSSNPPETEPDDNISKLQTASRKPATGDGAMFAGCCFYPYGFPLKRQKILSGYLLPHGGQVTDSFEGLASSNGSLSPKRHFMIMPPDLHISQYPPIPPSQPPLDIVTVWWLERCLHQKKFAEPSEHVIGRPFAIFPIEGFSQLSIATSAFTGIDLLHVSRTIQLLGASYSEDLTQLSSVIVVQNLAQVRKDKLDHAQQWKIPIVESQWLWDSISSGTKLPFQKYRIRSKKRRVLSEDDDSEDGVVEAPPPERSTSKTAATESNKNVQPVNASGVDNTAFAPDVAPIIKQEGKPAALADLEASNDSDLTPDDAPFIKQEDPVVPTDENNNSTAELESFKSEPLLEKDPNSSSMTVSTAPAPSNHLSSKGRENYNSTISDLLAKTKTATTHIPKGETTRAEKRGPKRILGRVTSNLSVGSAGNSRATSVDSTSNRDISHENLTRLSAQPPNPSRNERIGLLMNSDKNNIESAETQPPATQLEYDDPESRKAAQQAMARLMGEKIETRKGGLVRQKAVTVGEIGRGVEGRRARRGRHQTGVAR